MNQYPVKTTIDGSIIRNCRLIADGDGAGTTVWAWDREKGEAFVLRQVPDRPERIGATEKWQVDDLVMEPQRGCGCQHPMYTFVPPAGSPE